MAFAVLLTDSAARDLEEIHDYVARHDAPGRADQLLDRLEKAFAALSDAPRRGAFPKELVALGIRTYREDFYRPYRILYTVHDAEVYILLIADGRRDMQALLQRRLLED